MKLKLPVAAGVLAASMSTGTAWADHKPAPQPGQADPYFHCLNDGTKAKDATPWFNNNFTASRKLSRSMLDQHIPQGLTTWNDYYGAGKDLLVMTAYHQSGGRARLQGIDPADGSKTHFVQLQRGTHAGGVAIVGKWVFVPGRKAGQVRRYDRARIARIFANGGSSKALKGKAAGTVAGTGFLTQAGNTIWAGTFEEKKLGVMRSYRVDAKGNLHATSGPIQVPKKTQGVQVLPNHFVFSTSFGRGNRSNLYVVKRGYSSLAASYNARELRCVRIPTMSEGVTASGGQIYVLFESGADCYVHHEKACGGSSGPDRVIRRLFRIPRGKLIDGLPVYRG